MIYLNIIKNVSYITSQTCHMPIEVVKNIKSHPQLCCITTRRGIKIICKIVPEFNLYCKSGYQVIADASVFINPYDITETIDCDIEESVPEHNITALTVTHVQEATVDIELKLAEHILLFKRERGVFNSHIRNVLKCYHISENCTINCKNNVLANHLGITKITVRSLKFSNGSSPTSTYVGQIDSMTVINIREIESLEHRKFTVCHRSKLGGLDDIFSMLCMILKIPWEDKTFKKSKAIFPTGVMLIGPPGCGKTSLVKQVCAECNACLIATSSTDLMSSVPSKTFKNFTQVVKKACALSEEGACVLFIDEIDTLCPQRNEESSIQELQMTSLVLLTLDDCCKYNRLFVMAATNRPYALDPAIRRAGRLEVEILLSVPDLAGRESILQVHSSDFLAPDTQIPLIHVAMATPGFVGADLQVLCDQTRHMILESNHKEMFEKNPHLLIEYMISASRRIVPSILKSLSFITAKPRPSPVGGLQSLQKELDDVLNQHTDVKVVQLMTQYNIRQTKGILLYGPRGCGKTRLVSTLAAKHSCTFIAANGSHLLSPYVGDSEKKVAALFHSARLAQPSILFIDEIDGVFGSRDESSSGVVVRVLTELLQAMDGADKDAMSCQGNNLMATSHAQQNQDGVLVVAATNHPNQLDSALLRPGRFDKIIYVPPPDYEARLEILMLKTSKLKLDDCVPLSKVAATTEGWTGAELETIVTQVTIQSIRNGHYNKERTLVSIKTGDLLTKAEQSSPSVTQTELEAFQTFTNQFGSLLS